jgi:hypothetical protein
MKPKIIVRYTYHIPEPVFSYPPTIASVPIPCESTNVPWDYVEWDGESAWFPRVAPFQEYLQSLQFQNQTSLVPHSLIKRKIYFFLFIFILFNFSIFYFPGKNVHWQLQLWCNKKNDWIIFFHFNDVETHFNWYVMKQFPDSVECR